MLCLRQSARQGGHARAELQAGAAHLVGVLHVRNDAEAGHWRSHIRCVHGSGCVLSGAGAVSGAIGGPLQRTAHIAHTHKQQCRFLARFRTRRQRQAAVPFRLTAAISPPIPAILTSQCSWSGAASLHSPARLRVAGCRAACLPCAGSRSCWTSDMAAKRRDRFGTDLPRFMRSLGL